MPDYDSFIYFFNAKYNNSRHNAYTQVFNELCMLRSDHPNFDLLSHPGLWSRKDFQPKESESQKILTTLTPCRPFAYQL